MFTRERPERAIRASSERPRTTATALRNSFPSLLLVCLAAGLVSGFFIAFYFTKHYIEPIGWDTARYLDQTNLVAKFGLHGVSTLALPRPSQVLTSRIGFPATVLTLSKLLHGSTFEAAAIVPIIGIAATALAAGAFVSSSLRRSAWVAVTVALVVGLSTALVRLIAGTYVDNILAAAVFAAALVPLVTAVTEGRGFVAAIALLAVGGLIHSAFFAFIAIVLAFVAVLYLPTSLRAWRRHDTGLLATPSARMGIVLGGSIVGAGAGIYGLLRTSPAQPELTRGEFTNKIRQDVPLYRFLYTTWFAVAGVAEMFAVARGREAGANGNGSDPARDRSRAWFVLVLLLAWGAVAAVGIAGYYAGRALPAHRFLAFLLPFPIFMALGFLGIGRVAGSVAGRVLGAGRSRTAARTARALGVAVVAVGIAAVALLGYKNLFGTLNGRGIEFLDGSKIQDATNGQAYLDAVHVPADAPVVFVIDTNGPDPQEFLPEEAHILRTVMRAERIQHAYFYLGSPENYLAGVQTVKPGNPGNFNVASGRFWQVLQPVLPQHPVALLLRAYNPAFGSFASSHGSGLVPFCPPHALCAPDGVLVLNGPKPAGALPVSAFPSVPFGTVKFTLFQVAGLVAVALIGIGWAVALLPVGLRPFEILALSLAFGLAAVVLGALLVDAAGIRLTGAPALLTPVLVAVAGWASGGWRLAWRGPAVLGI
jgi:hypothetical protein